MALNFDNIPTEKPSNNTPVEDGRYLAKIIKAEMRVGKESGNSYLSVSFKLDSGGFVNENFFDSDKPFNNYKIGRLLKSCGITLEGDFTLNDIRKVIVNKEVLIDATSNDRGYGVLDFTGNNEGIYPTNETSYETATAKDVDVDTNVSLDADVEAAIDEDF